MVEKASFFSGSGQERTRALQDADAAFQEWLRYYLGPTGIPDKLLGVEEGVEMISPVAGAGRMQAATRDGNYGEAALEGLGLVAPAGIAAYLAKLGKAAAPLAGRTLDEVQEAAKAFFAADMIPQGGAAADTGAEALMRGDDDLINIDELNWEADDFVQAPPVPRTVDLAPPPAAPVAGEATPPMVVHTPERADPVAETFDENGFLMMDEPPPTAPAPRAAVAGDNGGPAMSSRYINPNSGLYSPSYEAAKALKQNVGTPEQMRSMLLKGGAKEEELVYSGFDNWLKGKKKVTKQEIKEVLGLSAAGWSGNMPYVRRSMSAESGITGVTGKSLGDLQDELARGMRGMAIADRDAQIESELLGRGYRNLQFSDENEYRQMADKVLELYNNPASRGGLGPDGERLPPGRVANSINQIDRMMQLQGRSFDDPEIQRILDRLSEDNDFVIGPSGIPEHTEEVISRELPDFASSPYYGSLPTQTVDEIHDRVYSMSAQEVGDELGVSVEDILDNLLSPGSTQYPTYTPKGLRGYSENVYIFDDAGRGVLSEIEDLGAGRFHQPHFGNVYGSKTPIMFHTRTGELQTPQGPAYHVAELQSDIGQTYNEEAGRFFVPGSTPTKVELSNPEKDLLRGYVDEAKSVNGLEDDVSGWLDQLYTRYMDEETGTLNKNAPGYEEAAAEIRAARQEASSRRAALQELEMENWELFSKLQSYYGDVRSLSHAAAFGGDFSPDRFEEILAGTAKPKKGYGLTEKTAALPFATSTNRWVDAGLKNELINAAKADAEWFTLPMGADVEKYTYGDVEGQVEFYEKIVPLRLKELSKKFLGGAKIEKIEATGYGPNSPTYEVNAIRLTPELRKKLLEEGLPSFAQGGPVRGSSLDVDVFAFP